MNGGEINMITIGNSNISGQDVMTYEVCLPGEINHIITCNVFEIIQDILIAKYVDDDGNILIKGIYNNWDSVAFINDSDKEEIGED